MNFDIEVHWLRYRSAWFHRTSTSILSKFIDFDIEALRDWKCFDIEVLTSMWSASISKITSISKLKFIYGYRSSELRYQSFFDIEDLQYRSFYWFFRALLVLAQGCVRLQLGSGVTEHRLQCRHFIVTQFLAQALKQYRVRSAWRRRRRSGGEGSVVDGAAAAGNASRTDSIQLCSVSEAAWGWSFVSIHTIKATFFSSMAISTAAFSQLILDWLCYAISPESP